MKKLLLWCCLLWAAREVHGQTPLTSYPIDTASFQYLSNVYLSDYVNQVSDLDAITRNRKMHGRWETFWQGRVGNAITGINFGGINEILDLEMRTPASCLGGEIFRGNWTNIGPFIDYYGQSKDNNGRIVSLWVNPANMEHILAGSGAGGLWKTLDAGRNWTNITDQVGFDVLPGTMGVTSIAVHPDNINHIYIATGTFRAAAQAWRGYYGLGLMYSANGGITWQPDLQFRTTAGILNWTTQDLLKMAYSPTTKRLYAIYKRRVFMKPSTSQGWQDITPAVLTNDCNTKGYDLSDFEFTHAPGGRIIFSTYEDAYEHGIYTYTETGPAADTWTVRYVDVNGANPDKAKGIVDIGLTADDELYLNALTRDDVWDHDLYVTDLSGGPLELRTDNMPQRARELAVSQNNADLVYVTNQRGFPNFISRATDGASFGNFGQTHADGRAILIYDHGTTDDGLDDIIFCGTDGGVAMKPRGSYDFKSITGKGMCITQYYATASSPSKDGLMTAGAHDNGNFSYNRSNTQPWKSENPSIDGLIPAFTRNGVNISYTQWQDGMDQKLSYNPLTNDFDKVGISTPPDIFGDDMALRWMRPSQFDEQNVARVSFHFLWKRALSDNAWSSAFGLIDNMREPKPTITVSPSSANRILISQYKNPADFILSETDPNIAYIAFSDMYINNTDDLLGNLFITKNKNDLSILWENISPSLVTGCRITDVEIDPKAPNRLWISYENYVPSEIGVPNSSRQKRVIYSGNYGTSWSDVSTGLPATPVIKLLYIPGSDDDIFAATDVGVYRWSKARQQWECFNNNMPKTIVTGLEFLACSGKIRASTFGRGVWETPIDPDASSLTPVGETNIISSNTTWTSSKTINGSIRVKSGATLTISGSGTVIYMPSRGKIAVERGAKLIVDGARITNECDGAMWLGIQLAGDINKPPEAASQGYLELKNNATLEHARLAICNFDFGEGTGGGIIKASNSKINNCKMGVCLNNYPNYTYFTPGTVQSNCIFDNIEFIKDDPRYEIDAGGYFTSWLIKAGVDIRNCTFRYSLSAITWQQLPFLKRASGINASATGLRVENSSFDGYRRGIYINGYDNTPTRTAQIFYNFFDHNSESITLAVGPYADIRGNVIRNMYPTMSSSGTTLTYRYPIGIYLDYAVSSYVGCSNSVSGTIDGGPNDMFLKRIGVIANDIGAHAVQITDNSFNDLSIGSQTQGVHMFTSIFCNAYNRNKLAWAVNPHTSGQIEFLNNQGTSCDPVTGIRAGNRFVSNQRDIHSYSGSNWQYYAGNGANENPNWAGTMTMNNCATTANSQCNRPRACPVRYITRLDHGRLLTDYKGLVDAGSKYSFDGRAIQREIVWGYNDLEDETGLRSFLENENDDQSRKLLIPMYINAGMITEAINAGNALDLPSNEKQAYLNYYTVMANLKQEGRRIDALTPTELNLVRDLAATNLEVSRLAKGLLEYAYGEVWEHPVEEVPMDPISKKIIIPETPGRQPSTLADAAPNPADNNTLIIATINAADAVQQPKLVIRTSSGMEVWKTKLQGGENRVTVPVKSWQAGVYFYNLELENKVIASKKLSVIP